MARRGITDVCLTPHLRANQAADGPPARHDDAFDALRAAAPELPRLHRGAEVMLDRPLPARCRPHATDPSRRHALHSGRVSAAGLAGRGHQRAGPRAGRGPSGRAGAPRALQLLLGRGGDPLARASARRCRWTPRPSTRPRRAASGRGNWCRGGSADILAGDNHGDDRTIAAGADFLIAQDGPEQAELLTVRNPAAILRDEPLAEVPPLLIRRTWTQRIRHLLGGEQ